MKFTPGIAFGAMSGSIGGTTFSRNASGPYVRTRAVGVNPNSPLQQAARGRFAALAVNWGSDLDQDQRDAWNLYAKQITWKDKLGQDINLTGYSMFIRSNTVVLAAGATRVDDGPTTFTLADSDPAMVATISEGTQLISVAFDDTLDWLDEDGAFMQISMSRPVSAGVTFIPPTLRVADFIPGDGVTPPTTPTTMAVPFAVTEGQKVLVEGRIVRADGRESEPFRVTSDVAA